MCFNAPPQVNKSLRSLVLYTRRKRLKAERLYYKALNKQIVHFLHIGKTGGTAIKEALKNQTVTSSCKIFLHGHRFTLRTVPQGDKCVFFVRDPVSRFVSAFYSRQRMGQPRYLVPWSKAEERSFSYFKTPNQLALALSSEDEAQQKQAKYAMRCITHVNTSFATWLGDEEYFLSRLEDVLLIGHQESLTADFSSLKRLLTLSDAVKLPEDEAKSHQNSNAFDKRIDEKARQNLQAWYANDYEYLKLFNSLTDVGQ